MGLKERTHKIDVSYAEKSFIEYCREIGFGKLTEIIIKNGEPVAAEKSMQSIRFDIEKK